MGPTLRERSPREMKRVSKRTRELTNDVGGVGLHEVPELRGVTAIDNPATLCVLVKFCFDHRLEILRGASSPVGTPVKGVQVDMRYVQQLRNPST